MMYETMGWVTSLNKLMSIEERRSPGCSSFRPGREEKEPVKEHSMGFEENQREGGFLKKEGAIMSDAAERLSEMRTEHLLFWQSGGHPRPC